MPGLIGYKDTGFCCMNEYLLYQIIRISIPFGFIIVLLLFNYFYKQKLKADHPPYFNFDYSEGKQIAKVYIWRNGSKNSKSRYFCYEFAMINDEWTLINPKFGKIFAIIIGLLIFIPASKSINNMDTEYNVQLYIVLSIFTLLIVLAIIGDEYIEIRNAHKIFLNMLEDPNKYMHY